jgi:uncharacterized protein YceH (UPF0502 family)
MILDQIQARVLGTLVEKEIVTPENYPLSLNALIAGCNQKSSRDPVMELSEEDVRQALHALERHGLTAVVRDSRVAKFEHQARTVLNLRRDETAVVCLLLLRGPQTPGELRARADRMYAFDDTGAVESTLARLMSNSAEGDPQARGVRPIVAALPRQPGSREVRYAHLLSGPVPEAVRSTRSSNPEPEASQSVEEDALLAQRMKELESQMEALRAMVDRLQSRLDAQSKQEDSQRNGSTG